jgi:GTP-binding protein
MEKGKIISSEFEKATLYALASLEAHGVLFAEPGDFVYSGMVIRENAKQRDLEVNPVRAKATTNMRTQNKEEKVKLAPPKKMNVEGLIGYMSPHKVIEVTPNIVRLRKAELDLCCDERKVGSCNSNKMLLLEKMRSRDEVEDIQR